MEQSRLLSRFACVTIAPVLAAHAALIPFWLAQAQGRELCVWLPTVQVAVTALAAPGWLAFQGCRLVLRHIAVAVPFGLVLLVGTLALNVFLDYAVWGITTDRFWTPDRETLIILGTIALLATGITLIPPTTALAIHHGRVGRNAG